MLRYTVVCCVYFSQMNAVSSIKQWFEQIHYSVPVLSCQKSFDVFEEKRSRPGASNCLSENRDEVISMVATTPHSRRRESLTRRAPNDDINSRKRDAGIAKVAVLCCMPQISRVRFYRGTVVVHSTDGSKTSVPKP